MGERSSFNYEENIFFRDAVLKQFAKDMVRMKLDEHDHWKSVRDWYETNEKFSFAIFNDWKLHGYWYESTGQLMNELAYFLNREKGMEEQIGCAEFVYPDGTPFKFMINYDDCIIYCEYVPLVWETMYFKEAPKIPEVWMGKLEAMRLGDKL
jgi:hypothetical protein